MAVDNLDPFLVYARCFLMLRVGGAAPRGAPGMVWFYLRSDLNAARSSSLKSWGCSQAAKWPPRSSRL